MALSVELWNNFRNTARREIATYVHASENARLADVKKHVGLCDFDTKGYMTHNLLAELVQDGDLVRIADGSGTRVFYRAPTAEDRKAHAESTAAEVLESLIDSVVKEQERREREEIARIKASERAERVARAKARATAIAARAVQRAARADAPRVKPRKLPGFATRAPPAFVAPPSTTSDSDDDFYIRRNSTIGSFTFAAESSVSSSDIDEDDEDDEDEVRCSRFCFKRRTHSLHRQDTFSRTRAAILLVQMRERELARADKRRALNPVWERVRHAYYQVVCDKFKIKEAFDGADEGAARFDALFARVEGATRG